MSNDKSFVETINLLVYEVCHADGYQEICFFSEKDVEKEGGVAALEADCNENAMWFYPLGKITGESWGDSGLRVELRPVTELIKAWEELGSPKIIGMAGKGAGLIQ